MKPLPANGDRRSNRYSSIGKMLSNITCGRKNDSVGVTTRRRQVIRGRAMLPHTPIAWQASRQPLVVIVEKRDPFTPCVIHSHVVGAGCRQRSGIYDYTQARIVDCPENGDRIGIGAVNDDNDLEFAPNQRRSPARASAAAGDLELG